MDISVDKLLSKIEKELVEAKGTSSDTKLRERVHAIKTMCELILEESNTTSTVGRKSPNVMITPPSLVGQVATTPVQQERLVIDEESNGESIFDF